MPHPNWSQEAYLKAYRFAATAHRGQLVPGTDLPYVMHLSSVGMEVIAALHAEPDRNGDLAVQWALLHDVIEDTAVKYQAVADEFGGAVAQGVRALSKDPALEKPLQMADSLCRIQQQPSEVWMVKLADRISNLQPPPSHWTREKMAYYQAEAKEILAALGPASAFLSARLGDKIERYNAYL